MHRKTAALKYFFYLATLLSFLFANTRLALADSSSCQLIYGGGQTCPPQISFTLKTQILKPDTTSEFIDNLSVNDPKYKPGGQAIFKITIKNTGSRKIGRVEITDTLPDFVNFVMATAGNFYPDKKTLTATFNDINPDKSIDFSLVVRIVGANLLRAETGVFCLANNARAFEENGLTADAVTQFCVERQILGIKNSLQVFKPQKVNIVPKTGAEAWPIIIFGFLFIAGILLLLKQRKLKRIHNRTSGF